jgi:creatinine amidohydrolase
MPDKPWKLSEINLKDVRDMGEIFRVAVLPFGATEPHNYHLPYGTDFMTTGRVGEEICARAWEKGARVVLLPTVPYGLNWNLTEFPMTMNVKSTTHGAIIRDIAQSLEKHGIRKLVILNGHGGNEFKAILRDMCAETDMFICMTNWWQCAPDVHEKLFERPGEHGDEMETSVFWSLYPELVKFDQAADGSTREPMFEAMKDGCVWITRPWHRATKSSGYGDPALATPEKGKEFLEAVFDKLANFIVELSDAEMEGMFPYRE